MPSWLFCLLTWYLQRRAETLTMRQLKISRGYLRAAVAHCQNLASGAITYETFLERTLATAYRYPKDSGLREYLLAEEFCQCPPSLPE